MKPCWVAAHNLVVSCCDTSGRYNYEQESDIIYPFNVTGWHLCHKKWNQNKLQRIKMKFILNIRLSVWFESCSFTYYFYQFYIIKKAPNIRSNALLVHCLIIVFETSHTSCTTTLITDWVGILKQNKIVEIRI